MALSPQMVEAAQAAADQLAPGKIGNRAVRNAVIAWWAAEDGYTWPTNSRNNPGNIRPGLESPRAIGTDARNFLIFPTPGVGVDAFVDLINRGSPYAGVRASVALVGNGQAGPAAIADAVGRSPWGTNASTMRGALAYIGRALGNTPSPTGTGWATVHRLGSGAGGGTGGSSSASSSATAPAPASSAGVVLAVYPVQLASTCSQVTLIAPGPLGKNQSAVPIPKESIGDPCTQCATGYVPGVVGGQAIGPVTGPVPFGFVDPATVPPGVANACIRSDLKVGDSVAGSNAAGVAGDIAGAVTSGILAGLGPALTPLLYLGVILALVAAGLYLLATSEG